MSNMQRWRYISIVAVTVALLAAPGWLRAQDTSKKDAAPAPAAKKDAAPPAAAKNDEATAAAAIAAPTTPPAPAPEAKEFKLFGFWNDEAYGTSSWVLPSPG
jgi:hypothetical protein